MKHIWFGMLVFIMILSTLTCCDSASLVGKWNFEGDNPLSNKVSGVTWESLTLNGIGATVSDGRLVLPRYLSGSTWYQSSANTMLKSDLGSGNYFNEMTIVLWVNWSGFDAYHYGRIAALAKFSGTTYSSSTSSWKAGQTILYGGYSEETWRSYRKWEYLNGGSLATSTKYCAVSGEAPSAIGVIKIAQVLRQVDIDNYELKMYWDTGSGLAQLGNSVIVPASEVNAFGQYNTNCLVSPAGGKRYDGFGIMDSTSRVPSLSGSIFFEEIRLYSGAMDAVELDSLQYDGRPGLVGQWTFDGTAGTGPLDNKAPGVVWDALLLEGAGPTIIDGKLKLPRYQYGGAWNQSNAVTMLATDLGANGYFKEQTHIAWMYWPDFDTVGCWNTITHLGKFKYRSYALFNGVAGQGIAFKANDDFNWGCNHSWEYSDNGSTASSVLWCWNRGIDPPTDRYIKVAQVLKQVDDSTFQQTMYWDINDGAGLVQVGNVVTIPASQVNAFGQNGSNCLVAPSAGKRYDGFGIMDYAWSVPAAPGDIWFDEVRLYAGAMNPDEIAGIGVAARPRTDHLVGQWTFDYTGRTDPTSNKATGINWDPLTLSDEGAFIQDGSLELSAYQDDGVWTMGTASSVLKRAVLPYQEKTFVLWLSLDKLGDADDVLDLFGIKRRLSPNQPGDSLAWNYDKQFFPEIVGTQGSVTSGFPYAAAPPALLPGQLVKLAAVWSNEPDSMFTVKLYLDKMDGSGLQLYGTPMRFADSVYLNSFGNADDDRVEFASQTDNLTGATSRLSIEEARIYDIALDLSEIAGLDYIRRPVPVAAHLVGEWTFDGRGGTNSADNKAPGVTWDTLSLSMLGAEIVGGKLRVKPYQTGNSWELGSASSTLRSEIRPFRNKTYVMWLSLDSLGDFNDIADICGFRKIGVANQPGDRVAWSTDKQFYPGVSSHSGAESFGYPFSFNSPELLPGRTVKLAAVWKDEPQDQFSIAFYLDKLDGAGLQPYGSALYFDDAYLNTFGDADIDVLQISPVVNNLAGATFALSFEEIRIYNIALSEEEIDKLAARQPEDFLSRSGANLRLDGQPYRAIGFNMCHMFSSYAELRYEFDEFDTPEAQKQQVIDALLDAEQSNVPFLRFWATGFYPRDMLLYFDDPYMYWQKMDEVIDLCRQSDIKLIPSVYWEIDMWPAVFGENVSDVINPASRTYKARRDYARELVLRYRDDPIILSWEVANESFLAADINVTNRDFNFGSNLYLPGSPGILSMKKKYVFEDSLTTNTLLQMYQDASSYVRGLDPNHMVESGDAMRRQTSESLRVNFPNTVWITDTIQQNLTNLAISQQIMDMYCIHCYGDGTSFTWPGHLTAFEFFREEARAANSNGYPLYVGETGQTEPLMVDDPTGTWLMPTLEMFEAEGADLISLWAWHMPSFTDCYFSGSTYPVIMQHIAQFNEAYANPSKPRIGIGNKSAVDQIVAGAASKYEWVLWGRVSVVSADEFLLDDGSGVTIRVAVVGHGLNGGEFVSVSGEINANANPPVLISDAAGISILN